MSGFNGLLCFVQHKFNRGKHLDLILNDIVTAGGVDIWAKPEDHFSSGLVGFGLLEVLPLIDVLWIAISAAYLSEKRCFELLTWSVLPINLYYFGLLIDLIETKFHNQLIVENPISKEKCLDSSTQVSISPHDGRSKCET